MSVSKGPVALVATLGLLGAACGSRVPRRAAPVVALPSPSSTVPSSTTIPAPTTTRPAVKVAAAGVGLTPFASCEAFLGYVKAEASAEVTPYGLPGAEMAPMLAGVPSIPVPQSDASMGAAAGSGGTSSASSAATPAAGGAATQAGAGAPSGFSTTNDQEAGVDEPDIAKTDGHLLVTLAGNVLEILDVTGTPHMLGSLALTSVPQQPNGLFLVGQNAVVLGQGQPAAGNGGPVRLTTQVTVVDLTNPSHASVVRSFTVEGNEVSARLIGQTIELVVTSEPQLAFVSPQGPAAAPQSLLANRAIIATSTLGNWLPAVSDSAGVVQQPNCGVIEHTAQPDGLGTVSVVSIDPTRDTPVQTVSVLGNAQTVYASTTHLYVAGENATALTPPVVPTPVSPGQGTIIHAFDVSDASHARYLGSGVVPGTLLNQYSLSELAGDLRVATTVGIPAPPPGEGMPVPAGTPAAEQPGGSQSFVSVLRPRHGVLTLIGQVGGLGHGQKIYAVRFIGALGYVVTFRQLDPLYVVDLSNPFHPAVRGALELSGYSAYLHPLDAGHVLGVGGSADANGRRTGLQLSLFDVRDPNNPAKVADATIPNGSSAAESDPHAFLWWAPDELAVMPVTSWGTPQSPPFDGAMAFRVDAAHGISVLGKLATPQPSQPPACSATTPCVREGPMPIVRDLVIGNRLYSISSTGAVVSDLATLSEQAWLAF